MDQDAVIHILGWLINISSLFFIRILNYQLFSPAATFSGQFIWNGSTEFPDLYDFMVEV